MGGFTTSYSDPPKGFSSWTIDDARQYKKDIETTLVEFLYPNYVAALSKLELEAEAGKDHSMTQRLSLWKKHVRGTVLCNMTGINALNASEEDWNTIINEI